MKLYITRDSANTLFHAVGLRVDVDSIEEVVRRVVVLAGTAPDGAEQQVSPVDPEASVKLWALFTQRSETDAYDMSRRITASVSKADMAAFMHQIDGTMGCRFFDEAVVVGFDADTVSGRWRARITYSFATALDLWSNP